MAAPPALPWGRAPSPPPKRARTEGGVEASAPPASAWARMAAKPPSAYNLEAGTRLEVAWDFKFDGDDAGGDHPRTFTKWCAATLERVPSDGEGATEAWQLRYDADADSDSEGDAAEEGAAAAQGPTSPAAPARKAEGGDAPDAATATAEEAEEHDAAEDVRRAFAAAYADAEAGLPPAQHPPAGADVAAAHPAPPLTGTEDVRRVEFLTSCRLRDLSEAAADPAGGGMLTWRRLGCPLVVHLDSEPDDAENDADAEAEDAAWEEEARAVVEALPMEQRQRLAGGLRAFCEELATRVATRVGPDREVTAEDVREVEASMRADWAAHK